MKTADIKIGRGFLKFLTSPLMCVINLFIGGYGSGKSYAIAYKLIMTCLESRTQVAVFRKSFSSHKNTTYKLLCNLIKATCLEDLAKPLNETTSSIRFKNGSEIIFMGLQDAEKLKSLEGVEIAWIEEASEIEKTDFTEVIGRLRQKRIHIILSSNPLTEQNWLYDYFFIRTDGDGNEETLLHPEDFYDVKGQVVNDIYYHHSTVLDNPFVPQTYVESLMEFEKTDPFKYEVAFKGRFGVLGLRVFTNWEIYDDDSIVPDKAQTRRGMDFGYVTSYDGALKTRRYGKTIYVEQEYYKKGQDDLDKSALEISEAIGTGSPVFADSQERRLIEMIQGAGRHLGLTITPCRKGQESVKAGYRKLKAHKIMVHKRCKHFIKTIRNLAHKEVNGLTIEDEFNFDPHLMDALRYAYSYDVHIDNLKGDNLNYSHKMATTKYQSQARRK